MSNRTTKKAKVSVPDRTYELPPGLIQPGDEGWDERFFKIMKWWGCPAALQGLMVHAHVHNICSWDDMKSRLQPYKNNRGDIHTVWDALYQEIKKGMASVEPAGGQPMPLERSVENARDEPMSYETESDREDQGGSPAAEVEDGGGKDSDVVDTAPSLQPEPPIVDAAPSLQPVPPNVEAVAPAPAAEAGDALSSSRDLRKTAEDARLACQRKSHGAASRLIGEQTPSAYGTRLLEQVTRQIAQAFTDAQREETKALFDSLGQGEFKLSEDQKDTGLQLSAIIKVCRQGVLAKTPGWGKSVTAASIALAAKARVVAVVVSKKLVQQFSQEILKLVSPEQCRFHILDLEQMPIDKQTAVRTPLKDTPLWGCVHGELDEGRTHFVFIPPSFFNTSMQVVDILCHIDFRFIIVDEVHQSFRKTKTAGVLLGGFIQRCALFGVDTLFVSGTPVQNRPEEAENLLIEGNMHVAPSQTLRQQLADDRMPLGCPDSRALLAAISSKRTTFDEVIEGVPNAYTLVCRLPDEIYKQGAVVADAGDNGRKVNKRLRAQHGNREDIKTHTRWLAAYNIIRVAYVERRQSVCLVVDAVKELNDMRGWLWDMQKDRGGDVGFEVHVCVITGESDDDEYAYLHDCVRDHEPVIVLMTNRMCCGHDWSFLDLIIVTASPPCITDLQQILFRKTRRGQLKQTYNIVLYQSIDKGTYRNVGEKCTTWDQYYMQDPETAVPSFDHLSVCEVDEIRALMLTLYSRLPQLSGRKTCEKMCEDMGCVTLWARVSHIHKD
jgi:hypothetical protein